MRRFLFFMGLVALLPIARDVCLRANRRSVSKRRRALHRCCRAGSTHLEETRADAGYDLRRGPQG